MSDSVENFSNVDKSSPSVGSLHTGEVPTPSPTIICKICKELKKYLYDAGTANIIVPIGGTK